MLIGPHSTKLKQKPGKDVLLRHVASQEIGEVTKHKPLSFYSPSQKLKQQEELSMR
jgi:hypothetical protein